MTTRPKPHHQDQQCLQTALRILTRRDHSVHEIQQKLKLREYPPATIKAVVTDCIRLDYLNDQKAAQNFVLGFKRQGFGPFRITQKLRAKGIADDLIAGALSKHFDTEEQTRICQRVLTKKIKTSDIDLDKPQSREKIHRFLFNRGFSADTIQQAISAHLKRL